MRAFMSQASDRILSFDMRTLHEYTEYPAVVAYCFKKHTWYLSTSGPNVTA